MKRSKKQYTAEEVARHTKRDDAWIIVNGKVYNITAHVNHHPGWLCSCGISTVLAIMRTLGTDCTEEFHEVHPSNGDGRRQLPGFYIGDLVKAQDKSPAQGAPG